MCLKYCACHEKWSQVIRSAAPVTQNHLPQTEDLMLQNATPLRKSAPGPPNSSNEHVSRTAPATEDASLQILFKCPTPANAFETATKPSRFCSLVTRSTILCACHAQRHPDDIWTSKSGPNPWCFQHFDLDMCFPPKRRALFRHVNFQKWFCTFWLGNVLRDTTECNFSCRTWPHGSAPAALVSLLFDPPEQQIIGKNTVNRDFATFRAPASSFFRLFLFFDSSHLCFSICPYCRKFHF